MAINSNQLIADIPQKAIIENAAKVCFYGTASPVAKADFGGKNKVKSA